MLDDKLKALAEEDQSVKRKRRDRISFAQGNPRKVPCKSARNADQKMELITGIGLQVWWPDARSSHHLSYEFVA